MSTKGKTWKWKQEAKQKFSEQCKLEKRTPKSRLKYIDGDPAALKYFHWMHRRCIEADRKCGFTRTPLGFKMFCQEMGSIPEGMLRPSVGRIDHDKGYVAGNIRWEEFKLNAWKGRRIEDQKKVSEDCKDEIPF